MGFSYSHPTVVGKKARKLSPVARALIDQLVGEAIAYGKVWWRRSERESHGLDVWDELYEAGLTRDAMYDCTGITPDAVRIALDRGRG